MKTQRSSHSPVDEIHIVNTFTRLIFGDDSGFSPLELAIIDGLRLAEVELALDDFNDMGAYLRALGVAEMISLVAAVERQLSAAYTAEDLASLNAFAHSLEPSQCAVYVKP